MCDSTQLRTRELYPHLYQMQFNVTYKTPFEGCSFAYSQRILNPANKAVFGMNILLKHSLSIIFYISTLRTVSQVLFINQYIHIYQPLRSGRIWHKVNF